MKKIVPYLITAFLLLNCANGHWYNEIRDFTGNLTRGCETLEEKVKVIDYYVHIKNTYEFNWYAVPMRKYWKSHIGDCTDMARLKSYMYRFAEIDNRLVHGFVVTDSALYKHDWIEYYNGTDWVSNEQKRFHSDLQKVLMYELIR